jgi:hypothetical protein
MTAIKLPALQDLIVRPLKRKSILMFVPLILSGPTAYLQTTYTSTNVPAVLAADGYLRHTASLGTTTAAMTISYDDSSTIRVPVTATLSNLKMLVSASSTDFSGASFVQADTVKTTAHTVSFHPPAGFFYTLALSAAADLAIVSNGPAVAAPGATITYKLEVTNTGPSDVHNAVVKMPGLSNITVSSITASGIQFSHSATPTSVAASYAAATNLTDSGIMIPGIAAFGGVAIVITGTAASTANSIINAGATVTMPAGMTDLDTANNTSAYSTTLFTPTTLSRYTFNRTATLAELGGAADPASANIDTAGNYHFKVVYTLMAGDTAIAPFGDTLKIPATFSAMHNKANGAINHWRGAAISGTSILYIQFYSNTPIPNGINVLDSLPYLNKQGPFASSYFADSMIYRTTTAGTYVPLGVFNFALGAVPAATNPNIVVANATALIRGTGNNDYNGSQFLNGYASHNLGVTALPNVSASAASAPDTVRPNATYPVMYTGFNPPSVVFIYGKDRGYRIDDGMVTFTTRAVPLPLNLLSFEAQRSNDVALLHWNTTDEVSTRSFVVERSGDGHDFVSIGTVAAVNSIDKHSYSFTDKEPLAGVNIYRLRMIDNKGVNTFSPARYLEFTSATAIKLMPNPAHNVLYIQNAPAGSVVSILNMEGQLVQQQELASAGEAMDIDRCNPGVYIVQVKQYGKVIAAEQLIKQ